MWQDNFDKYRSGGFLFFVVLLTLIITAVIIYKAYNN